MSKLTIQERNERFASLSPMKQRIQIAKDVLVQLNTAADLRRFQIVPGTYFRFDADSETCEYIELQDFMLANPTVKCQVCAKGAIFAAKALNYNNCEIDSNYGLISVGDSTISENLEGIFSQHQLNMIENAFEDAESNCGQAMNVMGSTRTQTRELWSAYYMFRDVENAEDRLKLIMENVVKNRGTFMVPRLKDFTTIWRAKIEYFVKNYHN